MSKKNYNNYSKPGMVVDAELAPEVPVEVEIPTENTEEISNEVSEVENDTEEELEVVTDGYVVSYGEVFNCEVLNVRKEASTDSEVVTTVTCGTMIEIDKESSTDEFYKVCTPIGIDGYCMKKFILLH